MVGPATVEGAPRQLWRVSTSTYGGLSLAKIGVSTDRNEGLPLAARGGGRLTLATKGGGGGCH